MASHDPFHLLEKGFFASRAAFTIRVRTKAQETKITGILPDGTITLDVAAVPEDNKANLEIIKFFTRKIGCRVEILVGKTSKEKVLRILEV
ncbi:DUF167 domain-containing protein [Candidatus Woesearchaeota archaeon]|nr:DUF167 domain-containing protein [Candidatus Woesearchaeota archaeon]